MAKPNDPDGPLHKWGEPEGVADYMKKTPGQKKNKTIKVGEDTVHADDTHYALVKKRKVIATGTKEEMLNMHQEKGGRVWVSTKGVGEIVEMKSFKEAKYSVDVDGLPRFYMDADSPAEIKKKLRSLLRKASSIDAVERSNDAKIKTDLRQRIKGAETDKRHVDEKLDPSKHDAGDYIKDFKDSDAPQFKGKSDKKKQKMAIAAYLSARREKGMDEERAWHKKDDEQKSKSKDHQTLNYTTRGGQKMKTAVHKDKAFGAVGHFRKMGHTDVHLEGYEGMSKDKEKHDTGGFRISNADAKAARDRLATKRKQKAQKSASQNKSFGNVRSRMEEVEQVDEGAKHKKVAKDLQTYAKKHGGIDKDDFLMAAQLIGDGKMRDFKKFLRSMDTDPRDGVIQILRRNGLKESFMDVDEGIVNAVSTARRMAGNMTGAAKKIDKMRPKKKGGDFSENPRVKKKLQKYNEGMESWKQFLESSCGGGHKKRVKEGELSPAQKKHMDTDKDGDIDGKDLVSLRNKKKS